MTESINFVYQKALIYASLDEFTPSDALGDIHGGCESCRWAHATLQFIRKNLSAKLIEFNEMQCRFALQSHRELLKRLQIEYCDWKDTKVPSTLWHSLLFVGTKSLDDILRRHELSGWESLGKPLNIQFIEEIKDIYY